MKYKVFFLAVLCGIFVALTAFNASGFGTNGCESDCKKCHSFTNQDVQAILKKLNLEHAKILGITQSPVRSLWEVTIDDRGKQGLFYVDFSKRYIISGQIIQIDTKENKTAERISAIQVIKPFKKINVKKVSLDNALVMGNPAAPKKIIIFTDPECPFCGRLHHEMKKVVEERRDIVFYIKLFPLVKLHEHAYWKSKSIICNNSLKMLDDNFEGKQIQKTECTTKEPDATMKLAESLGITGTPTLIFPDGNMYSGAISAKRIIEIATSGRK